MATKKTTDSKKAGGGSRWGLISACAAGFVTGAVVALLYAPADGATTRKNIIGKVNTGMELVSTNMHNYSQVAAIPVSRAKFQVERLFAAVTAGVEEAKKTKHSFDLLI